MKKNKFVAIILALVTVVTVLSGCGVNKGSEPNGNANTSEKSETQKKPQTEKSETQKTSENDVDIEILGCEFDNEIKGIDEEISSSWYTKKAGKVYVNLALKITNKSSESLSEKDFAGYFEYSDLRYDLQYELANVAPKGIMIGDDINPDHVGVVYMIGMVEEAAMNSDITVYFSVKGKEFEEKVSPIDNRSALDKKTKVSIGDKVNVNGLYDFEVIDCKESKYLQATNFAESKQYTPEEADHKVIDLLLKVKNNTETNLGDDENEITGYVSVSGQYALADVKIEVNDNTDLQNIGFMNALKPGQEEYIHICAIIKQSESIDNSAIRFNLGGNCYYCVVE